MVADITRSLFIDFSNEDDILIIKAKGVISSLEELLVLSGKVLSDDRILNYRKILVDYLQLEMNIDIIDVVNYINRAEYPEEFKFIKVCLVVNFDMCEKADLWQNINHAKDRNFNVAFTYEDAKIILNKDQ